MGTMFVCVHVCVCVYVSSEDCIFIQMHETYNHKTDLRM